MEVPSERIHLYKAQRVGQPLEGASNLFGKLGDEGDAAAEGEEEIFEG